MKQGAGAFNKSASIQYGTLEKDEKEKYRVANVDHMMTAKDVIKAGGKIFARIRKMVCYV